jgi:methylenetetrahydrofolate dehydrogenase (NADP+)/methenyltetrahydrofolate cyclohydrolase
MRMLEGKKVAEAILADVEGGMKALGVAPCLAVVLVGNDPASRIYVGLKERAAARIGIGFRKTLLPEDVSQGHLLEEIGRLNADPSVHGILVQLPLPERLETQAVIDTIDPRKDVDGFHPQNEKLFLEGRERFVPVFPRAILELAASAGVPLSGRRAVVIGNSDAFGRMMSATLARAGVEVEFVNYGYLSCRQASVLAADIVVTAAGVPGSVTGKMIKTGAVVIDGGISKADGKVLGDVDRTSVEGMDIFLSPVPGGVGPVTVALLLENTFLAAERRS